MEEENGVVEEGTEPTGADAPEPTGEEGAEPSEQEAPPADPAAEPEPKRNKVQERIDEITRARRQAEADADYWRKVATGEIKPQQQTAPVQTEIPGLPPKPQLDQFEDYDNYVEALGAWGAEKTILTREYTAQQTQRQTAQQAVYKTHSERMEAAKEKYADIDEVMALAPDCQFNQDAFAAMLESEQSADIVYHLSKNAKEAERIAALPPVKQIMEIARLEDKFKTAPAQPVKRVSQAPAPLNPIGGSGDPAPKDPDNMSDEEWLAYERNRLKALGRRY